MHEHMVWVPGGEFSMGSDFGYPEESPARRCRVDGFWMDVAPVTVEQFSRFVADSHYVTTAEQRPDPAMYPGADPDLLVPGSLVFVPPPKPVPLDDFRRWWGYLPGAHWRCPTGPGSMAEPNHPVVHVSRHDAVAYARWCGKELPTEAQWECAARAGGVTEYVWGDELEPDGLRRANTWHGRFPWEDTDPDGFTRTSPVGSYPPNDLGLVDMIGNVWEWTRSTPIATHLGGGGSCCAPTQSPTVSDARGVIKGGSHLCSPDYCRRYRPAARQFEDAESSTSHLGFRCMATRGVEPIG